MWPFNKRSRLCSCVNPFEWIQIFIFSILLVSQACLPCLKVDIWGSQKDAWRWRRMWKSDDKVEKEQGIQRARCCANDRDEWRERARSQGLIAQRSGTLRKTLCMRQTRYWLRSLTNIVIRRFGDTKLNNSLAGAPFFKLPPEVREQIYIHYMLDWSSSGLGRLINQSGQAARRPIPPHEPPLTRVSKLVRAESLHVFYRTARFPLVAHPTRCWGPLELPLPAVDWYHHLGPGKLSLIRHLELYICLRRSVPGFNESLVYHVDFKQGGNKVSFKQGPGKPPERPWVLLDPPQGLWMSEPMQQFCDELLLRFRSVARSLGGTGIVAAKDIYQFVS